MALNVASSNQGRALGDNTCCNSYFPIPEKEEGLTCSSKFP